MYDVIYISFQEICMKSYMLLENSFNQYMNRNVNSERILSHFFETLWRHLKYHPNITELQLTTFTWLQKSRNSTITLMQFIFNFFHWIKGQSIYYYMLLDSSSQKKPRKQTNMFWKFTARPRVARFLGSQKQCTTYLCFCKVCVSQGSEYQDQNVSTTPITALGCRQCLPLSVVQLKGEHRRKPNCRNGVVDTFGLYLYSFT